MRSTLPWLLTQFIASFEKICSFLHLEMGNFYHTTAGLISIAHWCVAGMLLILGCQKQYPILRPTILLGSAGLLLSGTLYALPLLPIHLPLWSIIVIDGSTAAIGLGLGFKLFFLTQSALSTPRSEHLKQKNRKLERKIVERKQAEQSLRLTAQQLKQALEFESLLKRITDKVRDSLDEKQILQTAVRAMGEGLEVRSCNAALYDLVSKTAIVHYEYTTSLEPVQGRVMSMENSPWLYDQLLTGQYFQFCSLFPNPARGRVSMVVCPIIDDNGVLGDLWLVNNADYGFKEMELRLMQQVANQCAIALRQARLYQESQAQIQELKRLNQLKDDFLSTVSHELRTPVANVKLATRMLGVTLDRRAAEFEDQEKLTQPNEITALNQQFREKELYYLKVLQDECEREIHLVNDLLDLQRLEEDQMPLTTEKIDLIEWLPKTVKPFENRATNRQQTLILKVENSLEPIHSDPVSLGRILTELLNNACKYTPPEETITVEVTTTEAIAQFKVTNSGIVIPARELPHIFEKFYRVPSTDPWKQGGTGLGLALIETLVHHLGGTIEVRSHSEQTCFDVQLPLFPTCHTSQQDTHMLHAS